MCSVDDKPTKNWRLKLAQLVAICAEPLNKPIQTQSKTKTRNGTTNPTRTLVRIRKESNKCIPTH